MNNEQNSYVLGHADQELDRLTIQARILEPSTRQLLQEAGLRPGMRVLDIGCGSGDVSFLAASLVGPAGRVVGVDLAAAACEEPAPAPCLPTSTTCRLLKAIH